MNEDGFLVFQVWGAGSVVAIASHPLIVERVNSGRREVFSITVSLTICVWRAGSDMVMDIVA
jgi:hypothetical protein